MSLNVTNTYGTYQFLIGNVRPIKPEKVTLAVDANAYQFLIGNVRRDFFKVSGK